MWKQLIMTTGVGILLFHGQTASASGFTPKDLVQTEKSIQQATKQISDSKQSIQAIQKKLQQINRQGKALKTKIEKASAELESYEEQLTPKETSLISKVLSNVLPSAKAEAAESDEERSELLKKKTEADEVLKKLTDDQQDVKERRQKYETSHEDKSKQYKQLSKKLSDLKKQYEALAPDQFLMPATGRLSQGFGSASGQFGYTFHNGLDIAAKAGTPVYAAAAGKVTKVSSSGPYGNHVQVEHNLDGEKWTTVYAHMHRVDVKQGQSVRQGEQIGQIGNTGNSSGPHLHFEVHKGKYAFSSSSAGNAVDPMKVAERLGGASAVKATF